MGDDDLIRRVAAAMWKAEAVDVGAPLSVAELRTPEAFLEQSSYIRTRWEKFARAAIAALPDAPAEDVRAGALKEAADSLIEASVWCDSQERATPEWHNGVVDARKHHIARILALIPEARP